MVPRMAPTSGDRSGRDRRLIVGWLALVYLTIFGMVLIGGTTRLSGSGLSMVEWKPLMGTLPPMGEEAWQETFDRYKDFPQYQRVNDWMELEDFKRIFFWEYLHRLMGRAIGLVFAVPWLFFLLRRKLGRRAAMRTFVAFALGGLQGLLGWYMVRSGLVDRPEVSHYRLAAHLGLALLLANYVLWLALDLADRERSGTSRGGVPARDRVVRRVAWGLIALAAIQVTWGAFMAGTRAGFMFPTFPKLGADWLPAGTWALDPGWRNLLENPFTINVVHRVLGTALLVAVPLWAWWSRQAATTVVRRHVLLFAVGVVAAQYMLGVAAVLTSIPVPLGVAHQGGGLVLLSSLLWAAFVFRER